MLAQHVNACMLSHAPRPPCSPVHATLHVAMPFTCSASALSGSNIEFSPGRGAGYRSSNPSLMVLAHTDLRPGGLPRVPTTKEKRRGTEGKGAEGNSCSLRKGGCESWTCRALVTKVTAFLRNICSIRYGLWDGSASKSCLLLVRGL